MNEQLKIDHNSISLHIKREDLLHPYISGNKFRKLKYNIAEAKHIRAKTLLTFGGAFSNHIVAVAAAGKLHGFETIGIIRGEELGRQVPLNSSLALARDFGMTFKFITRTQYKDKDISSIASELPKHYYFIPEGGTNDLAIKGCEEILMGDDFDFHYICCAVGTGGTIAGIANSAPTHQKILGFPALNANLAADIAKLTTKQNYSLVNEYHFGGYGKVNQQLIDFMNNFNSQYNIKLDPVYTGKMVYGVMDLISKDYFPENVKILMIHTGGLQGIVGMNQFLKSKNLPLINSND